MSADQKLALRLLFLPWLLATFDATTTLYYQPGAYWDGDFSQARDGNPFVELALRIHPLMTFPGTLAWFALAWFLIYQTAAWMALRVYIILIIGHTVGGSGWLQRYHPDGDWWFAIIGMTSFLLGGWAIRPYLQFWGSDSTLRSAALGGLDQPKQGKLLSSVN